MQIKVTIDKKGDSTVLAVNTLEDLRHDFQYFLEEAKTRPAVKLETMFLHTLPLSPVLSADGELLRVEFC
jgi:hypothetical protein